MQGKEYVGGQQGRVHVTCADEWSAAGVAHLHHLLKIFSPACLFPVSPRPFPCFLLSTVLAFHTCIPPPTAHLLPRGVIISLLPRSDSHYCCFSSQSIHTCPCLPLPAHHSLYLPIGLTLSLPVTLELHSTCRVTTLGLSPVSGH